MGYTQPHFLQLSVSAFSDMNETKWYLGLVDSHNSSLFTWIDGNLFGFQKFVHSQPSDIIVCVKDFSPGYTWALVHCSELLHVICKKSKSRCLFVFCFFDFLLNNLTHLQENGLLYRWRQFVGSVMFPLHTT